MPALTSLANIVFVSCCVVAICIVVAGVFWSFLVDPAPGFPRVRLPLPFCGVSLGGANLFPKPVAANECKRRILSTSMRGEICYAKPRSSAGPSNASHHKAAQHDLLWWLSRWMASERDCHICVHYFYMFSSHKRNPPERTSHNPRHEPDFLPGHSQQSECIAGGTSKSNRSSLAVPRIWHVP